MTSNNLTPAIEAAVELYFDTLYECDLAKFDKIFHPACMLGAVKEDAEIILPLPDYRKMIAERKSPQSKNSPREDTIEAIMMLSKGAALVRARVRVGDKKYIDHLNLICVGGRWQIFSKAYAEI